MSEYQYYEFQAIDRALEKAEQAELREVSSRASIGPRRFTNEYHWGDFKGNPVEWMDKYFDAHLYLSNFGNRALHLRLPLAVVDLDAIRPYVVKYVLEASPTATHLVLSFYSEDEPGRDYDAFDDNPSAALGNLLPVRNMLAGGDLRPLYLVWLLAVQNRAVKDNTLEPPVPPGLGKGDGILEDLAEFLWLDPALVEVAARSSGPLESAASPSSIHEWLAGLAGEEKDRWLARILAGDEQAAVLEFRKAFASGQKQADRAEGKPLRSAGALRAAAKDLEQQWREAEAREAAAEKAARDKKAAEERLLYLRSLEGSEANLWREVITLTDSSVSSKYDAAVRMLVDLRDLTELTGEGAAFAEKLEGLRELRRRRAGFLARLDKAGLK